MFCPGTGSYGTCCLFTRWRPGDGEGQFSWEPEPAFWVGRLLGSECGPNIWIWVKVWRPGFLWILSLEGPHPPAESILWDSRLGLSKQVLSGVSKELTVGRPVRALPSSSHSTPSNSIFNWFWIRIPRNVSCGGWKEVDSWKIQRQGAGGKINRVGRGSPLSW